MPTCVIFRNEKLQLPNLSPVGFHLKSMPGVSGKARAETEKTPTNVWQRRGAFGK